MTAQQRWPLERPVPSHAQLCVLIHHVFDRLGAEAAFGDVADETKTDLARAGFEYPSPLAISAAIEAVGVARDKGYRTPRRPRVMVHS